MEKAIIVDIDGTLANIDHRIHLLTGEKKHYSEFFIKMQEDRPNAWCIDIINKFKSYEIIFVTGRPSNFQFITHMWLDKCIGGYHKLFMRSEGDYRPDYEIKSDIYDNWIKDKYDVQFVVEDRKGVVKMWRDKGLVCLQCAEGDY